ncbi:hypothetical protein XENTR_v10001637 [Xenopus tropicalis]|nr:hypothetical protein XENTR_v10001637 [Xenopus tropicalis]
MTRVWTEVCSSATDLNFCNISLFPDSCICLYFPTWLQTLGKLQALLQIFQNSKNSCSTHNIHWVHTN